MRQRIFVFWVVGLLGWAGVARSEVYIDAGAKLWYAEPKGTDSALMYGPSAILSVGDLYWVRAFYLYGEYDYIQSHEPRVVQDFGIHDAEIVGGVNCNIFHVGLGARWTSIPIREKVGDRSRARRPNAMGPALVAGASQSFSEYPWGFQGTPWGWYAGASWMFYDVEDDDGEHLNIEAGISHMSHGFYKSIGFRFKDTFDHERMEGFVVSLLFEF